MFVALSKLAESFVDHLNRLELNLIDIHLYQFVHHPDLSYLLLVVEHKLKIKQNKHFICHMRIRCKFSIAHCHYLFLYVCLYLRKLPVERVRRRPPQQCPALTRDVSSNANVKSCENCSILKFLLFYFVYLCKMLHLFNGV